MRFSKEKIEELKQLVRIELVKNPSASIYTIQEELEKSCKHTFDKNFVAKLKRKVHRERAGLYNKNIYYELAKLEDLIVYSKEVLMKIIFDEEDKYKARDIIKAVRAVMDMEFTLFDAMLNAGIFAKNEERSKEKRKKLTQKDKELIDEAIGLFHKKDDG